MYEIYIYSAYKNTQEVYICISKMCKSKQKHIKSPNLYIKI